MKLLTLFGTGLGLIIFAVVLDVLIIGGGIWLGVKILQAMGILS